MALNERQKRFCLEYIKDFNGTRAAEVAGYSEKTARHIASENLTKPDIQTYLQELLVEVTKEMQKHQKKSLMTAQEVFEEIQNIASVDPALAFKEDGTPKNIHDIPVEVRKCIKSIDVYEDFTEGVEVGETTKITFWDKSKNLEMLGRILKMFVDQKEVHNTHSLDFARTVSEKSSQELVEMAKQKLKALEGK